MRMRIVKVIFAVMCLLGFTATAWPDATTTPGKTAQEIVGDEAVVSKVDNNQVTLVSARDKTKACTVSMSNTGDLKEGDKVKVQGDLVKKMESPASETESSK